jgi:hypothetical protein
LVLAQVLGFALCGYIAHLDMCDDWFGSLGTYLGGLEPYLARSSMDGNSVQTIEDT